MPLSKKKLTIKTTDDMQVVLVALLLILIIGYKCYLVFTPSANQTAQQKTKSYTNPNLTLNYPSFQFKAPKIIK